MLTLSTAYLAPVAHYHLILKNEEYQIDGKERFVKQSQRNRASIYGANGTLPLIIPLKKYSHKDLTEDIRISFDEDWQQLHWKSLKSAYRNSAYFEFYEDEFKPFFEEKPTDHLMEFNDLLEKKILNLLDIQAEHQHTTEYHEQEPDWRELLSPKNEQLFNQSFFPVYQQVFSSNHEFKPNLSIVDLLFNLGPASKRYLQEVKLLN